MKLLAEQIITFIFIFLLTVVLDLILFVGVGTSIPEAASSWFLNSFAFSIIILFWMFLGVPTAVAYYVVSKLHRASEGYEERPFPTKAVLITAAVLGVLTIVFFNILSQPKFPPYIFHPITESEFVQPTPIPESTPSAAFSLNWKTYTNTKCNYLVEYPEDLSIEDRGESTTAEASDVHFVRWDDSKHGNYGVEFIITDVSDSAQCLTNVECLNAWIEVESARSGAPHSIIPIKAIVLGTLVDGIEYGRGTPLGNQLHHHFVFLKNEKVWRVGFIAYNPTPQQKKATKINFDTFLSTFKFLE